MPLDSDSGMSRRTAQARAKPRVPRSRAPVASGLSVRPRSAPWSTRSLSQPRTAWPTSTVDQDQRDLPGGAAGERGGDGHPDRRQSGLAGVGGPDHQHRGEAAEAAPAGTGGGLRGW